MGEQSIQWDEARALFESDGSLRDLYVFGTTRDDWTRLLEALKASEWRLQFTRNGQRAALPENLAEYLDAGPDRPGGMLSIFVGGVRVNAHMFSEEQIELDIDPREVADEAAFAGLVQFMKLVADTLNKKITLTPENGSLCPLLLATPGTAGVVAGNSWVR
jgi:hypothetical protein